MSTSLVNFAALVLRWCPFHFKLLNLYTIFAVFLLSLKRCKSVKDKNMTVDICISVLG